MKFHFFASIFGLGCVIAQQPAAINDCFSCCSLLFGDDGPLSGENSLENGFRVDECQNNGCGTANLEESPCGVDNGNLDEACEAGFDLITEGKTDFFVGTDIDPTTFFCVDGELADSFAPTVSPTPPTTAPVESTETPTITTPDEGNQLPIILGVGVGASVILLILLVLLYPSAEKRRRKLHKGLTEDGDGSEEGKQNIVNPSLAGTLANAQRLQRPALNDGAESAMGQSVAETIATLRQSKLANSGVVKATFEVLKTFKSEHKDELGASRGEVLMGLSPVDDAWWIVKREQTGEVGMIPLAFLKELFSDAEDKSTPDLETPAANDPEDIF